MEAMVPRALGPRPNWEGRHQERGLRMGSLGPGISWAPLMLLSSMCMKLGLFWKRWLGVRHSQQ